MFVKLTVEALVERNLMKYLIHYCSEICDTEILSILSLSDTMDSFLRDSESFGLTVRFQM